MVTARTNTLVYISLALALVLWYVMFVIQPFNFWLMMSFSTGLLSLISLAGGVRWSRSDWSVKNILLGIGSALVLYGVFWIGNQVLILAHDLFPIVFPERAENISSVYANRGALPPALVGVLLFFPIGFGEEFFWRGFIQNYFAEKITPFKSYVLATLLYTAVHLSTGNPILLLAAFVCGAFWGAMYWKTGSLTAVLISHMLWDPLIFIIAPIQ